MFYVRSWFGVTLFLLMVIILWQTIERSFLRFGKQKPYPPSASLTGTYPSANSSGNSPTPLDSQVAQRLLADAQAALDRATADIHCWNTEPVILSGMDGGAADVDQSVVKVLAYLESQQRSSDSEIGSMKSRLESLRELVAAKKISASTENEIHAISKEVSNVAEEWSLVVRRRDVVRRYLSETETNSLNRRVLEEQFELLVDEIKQEKEGVSKAKSARVQMQIEVAKARQLAEEEEAKLVVECHSAEVHAMLSPFLIDKSDLGSTSTRRRTAGVSLTEIVNCGALIDSQNGRKALAQLGTNRKLRQHWPFGTQPTSWTPEVEQLLGDAQELLRRLGATLVSEGLLAK